MKRLKINDKTCAAFVSMGKPGEERSWAKLTDSGRLLEVIDTGHLMSTILNSQLPRAARPY